MNASRPETVVVIDDDRAIRLSCEKILARSGYEVVCFENGALGLEAVADRKPALVLVDLKMPGISGLDVIARVREIDPTAVVIVITGYASVESAVDAMKAGAYDFLPKPFSPDELRLVADRGLERRRLVLEARRGELERELLKRRFVTFVSHQLKSPLVAVHQYLEVLRRLGETEDVQAKREMWLDRCLERTRELTSIIEDWLTFASLEQSSLSRTRETVDVRIPIRKLVEGYEELATEQSVSLTTNLPANPCPVNGDPTCLTILFDNLIINAIRYNRPGGSVTVGAECRPGEVVVSVTDTGIGIPESYLSMLFDEFFRVGGRSEGPSGTGLGLPISRRIATEHGGVIDVHSVEGAGSTFTVRLPRHEIDTAPEDTGADTNREKASLS